MVFCPFLHLTQKAINAYNEGSQHTIAGTTASRLEKKISSQKKQMESRLLLVVAEISHNQPFVTIIKLQ